MEHLKYQSKVIAVVVGEFMFMVIRRHKVGAEVTKEVEVIVGIRGKVVVFIEMVVDQCMLTERCTRWGSRSPRRSARL